MMMEYSANNSTEAINLLENFWPKVTHEIQNLTSSDFKNPELPLARIKKIMKLDDEVKMISAEAPIIFAKASELFIQEVTIRAWLHTEENKRRTLQRNDVALAVTKYDQFDFLIDIVPREEIKPSKQKESHSPSNSSNSSTTAATAVASVNIPATTSVMNAIINPTDPTAASLLNVINGNINTNNAIIATATSPTATASSNATVATANPNTNNIQYYITLPANSIQNGAGIPLQLQNLSGLQTIQGLPTNIQTIQTLQGLSGLQNLQGAQIIINGQPAIFSVANRDC